MSEDRAQLSLTVLEAALGITFLLTVLLAFALGVPAADTREAQLDTYADDTLTILAGEAPQHTGTTRLGELARSPATFDRERATLERRVDRLLPDNLMFRVRTPQGSVGFQKPAGVPIGTARTITVGGTVTIWVWYA
jgi:hypothetical protein